MRQASGQTVSPASQDDDELKLMALRGIMQSDPEQALPDHREDAGRHELAEGQGPRAVRPQPEPRRPGARHHRERRQGQRQPRSAAAGDPLSRDHERRRQPPGPRRRLQELARRVGEARHPAQLHGGRRSGAAARRREDRDRAGAARRSGPAARRDERRRRAQPAVSDAKRRSRSRSASCRRCSSATSPTS